MTSTEYTEIVATIAVEQSQDKLERIVTMAKSAIKELKRIERERLWQRNEQEIVALLSRG